MKKWEIKKLGEIFKEFNSNEQDSNKYIVKRENLLRNLKDISELIPEVKSILEKFNLRTNTGAENAVRICQNFLEANVEKKIDWLIDLYKTEINDSAKKDIDEQIKKYLSLLDETERVKLGINLDTTDYDNLSKSLNLDIKNKITQAKKLGIDLKHFIDLEEKEDIYCKRGSTLLQLYSYYTRLKQEKGYTVAKKFVVEVLSKYPDENVRNFLPELVTRDSEFFDVYINYLKQVGKYYLVINTEDVDEKTKEQVTNRLDSEEQEKNDITANASVS